MLVGVVPQTRRFWIFCYLAASHWAYGIPEILSLLPLAIPARRDAVHLHFERFLSIHVQEAKDSPPLEYPDEADNLRWPGVQTPSTPPTHVLGIRKCIPIYKNLPYTIIVQKNDSSRNHL